MSRSTINRILKQFGKSAVINVERLNLKLPLLEARTLKPLVFGFRSLPHAEKMAAKRIHRERLAALPYKDPEQAQRIAFGCAAIREMNARNGVGRPPEKPWLE